MRALRLGRTKRSVVVVALLLYLVAALRTSLFLQQPPPLVPPSATFRDVEQKATMEEVPNAAPTTMTTLDPNNNTHLMNLFLQTDDPIIPNDNTLPPPKVRVRVILFEHQSRTIRFREGPTGAISDEVLNICMDGMERSPYFDVVGTTLVPDFHLQPNFSQPEDEDIVWMVDMRRLILHQSYSVHRQLVHLTRNTLRLQDDAQRNSPNGEESSSPRLDIVLMDFRDRFRAKTLCTKAVRELIELLHGRGRLRNVVQPIVRNRRWSDKRNFPLPGHVWDVRRDNACFGSRTLHVPYTVRSDYAEAVLEAYPALPQTRHNNDDDDSPAYTERPTQVAHFWPSSSGQSSSSSSKVHAKLRDRVTDHLIALAQRHTNWTIITDFVSSAAEEGRFQVAPAYLKALLTSQIIICAQRDDWEDHYRLFEAIIGGALVMTDTMLSLPEGLVDGKHIVVYHSLDELEDLLLYYLSHDSERRDIARRGWQLAMTRHRTYHWMERIFFGRIVTP